MISKFQTGDAVKLIEGTQRMTVIRITENYVDCVWVNHLNAEMHGSFPKHLLTKL